MCKYFYLMTICLYFPVKMAHSKFFKVVMILPFYGGRAFSIWGWCVCLCTLRLSRLYLVREFLFRVRLWVDGAWQVGACVSDGKDDERERSTDKGTNFGWKTVAWNGTEVERLQRQGNACTHTHIVVLVSSVVVVIVHSPTQLPSFEHAGLTYYTLLSPSITFSLFHSELKTYFFRKSYPPP